MIEQQIVQLNEIPAVGCPCGQARRAFGNDANSPASIHFVLIQKDSKTHYHKYRTEFYVVLEGEGTIELDGVLVSVKPLTAVHIPPNCRHRAIGKLTILNFVIPPFDSADEWFDEH